MDQIQQKSKVNIFLINSKNPICGRFPIFGAK